MESKRISLSPGTIRYRDTGNDAPPVVLIHGNSQSSEGFAALMREPALKAFRIVAPDLPGHGGSDPAAHPEQDYSLAGFGRTIAEFAEALGLTGALWAAHSLGGHLLIRAWEALPDPAGLLLWGTAPLGDPPDFPSAYPPFSGGEVFYSGVGDEASARKAAAALGLPGGEPDPQVYSDFLRSDPKLRGRIAKDIVSFVPFDEAGFLAGLAVPAVLARGDHDPVVTAEYLDYLGLPESAGRGVRTLPGTGHMPHRDVPGEFAALLAEVAGEAGLTGRT